MVLPLAWHRQFRRYTPSPPRKFGSGAFGGLIDNTFAPIIARQHEEDESYPAFTISGDQFVPIRISCVGGHYFPVGATHFERAASLLCGIDPGGFIPIVDADYFVVGHVGWATDGDEIFVPNGFRKKMLKDVYDAGKTILLYLSSEDTDYSAYERHNEGFETVYKVLTDPFGQVLAIIASRSADELAPPAIDPFLLIGIGELGVAVGRTIGKYLVRKAITAGRAATAMFRQAFMEVIGEEELATVWGAGPKRLLTKNQLDRVIEILRNGGDVHVESIDQMRQIQTELGQLGVRPENTSKLIPQRPAAGEIPGSFKDGRGTYRQDPPHPLEPGMTETAHNRYVHLNITLPNGQTLEVLVTGHRSF